MSRRLNCPLIGAHTHRMLSLICEGSCNPFISRIDALALTESKDAPLAINATSINGDKYTQYSRGTPALIRAQRTLTYTDHELTSTDRARCVPCGKERRFGRSL